MSTVSRGSAKRMSGVTHARVRSGIRAKRIIISTGFVYDSPKLYKAITWAAHMGRA